MTCLLANGDAKAQVCSVTTTNLNFGTTNVAANIAYNSTASMTYTCVGAPLATMRVCTSLGSGTGGTPTGAPRKMLSGVNQLNFNLYTNAAASNIFGSFVWPFSGSYPGAKDVVTLNLGGIATFTKTLYGRVLAGQTTAMPGTYNSSFAGHTRISYDYSSATACSSAPVLNSTTSFNVTTFVPAACVVSATTMDFGTQSSLSTVIDSTSTITTQCTNSTPYTISLDGGTSGVTNPAARKMLNGTTSILYGLYRDAARTQVWGSSIGTNTAASAGTGGNQNLTVFGRVHVQALPASGTYLDTITVTVTY